MTRVRDRSFPKTGAYTGTQYNAAGSIIYGPNTYSFSVVDADVMTDVVTPGYSRKSARGEVIISPMSKLRRPATFGLLNYTIERSDGVRGVYTGDYDILGSYDPLSIGKVVEAQSKSAGLAITDAYAAVGSPDVAVLTELVELKETLQFLYSPVKGMVTLTRRLRSHLNKVTAIEQRFAAKLAKWEKLPVRVRSKREKPIRPDLPVFKVGKFEATDVSSAWLAYRYGLMPLIYTFQDVEKLLKKRLEGFKPRATARGYDSREVPIDEQSEVVETWGPASYTVRSETKGTVTVAARAGVLYEPDFSLSSQLGIQWNRVPAALYEGIPLSFVSDWFHNGADLYDALTAEFRAQKILGAWVTTTTEYSVIMTQTYVPVANCTISGGQVTQGQSGKLKTRKISSLSDVKFFLRVELNSKRVADGFALIHQMLATARKK